jgi:ABC-type nitrate/sulfonate/bicarbonate transport system permease component
VARNAAVASVAALAPPGASPTARLAAIARHPHVVRFVSIALFLAVWENVGRRVNPLFLSYPTAIANSAVDLVADGTLQQAVLDSLYHLVIGFAIACVVGIVLGLLMGRYRILEDALDSFVNAAYVAPHAAFVPLIILWLGLGTNAKIFIIATATVFPILIATHAGARDVNRLWVEVGRSFGLSERQIFGKIVLPAVASHVVVGLRLGVGRAVTNMIVAEFFTSLTGLGGLIISQGNLFRTSKMFVGIVTLMLIGVTLTALVGEIERRVAVWRETERAAR